MPKLRIYWDGSRIGLSWTGGSSSGRLNLPSQIGLLPHCETDMGVGRRSRELRLAGVRSVPDGMPLIERHQIGRPLSYRSQPPQRYDIASHLAERYRVEFRYGAPSDLVASS
jgi:hypothetical protein